MVRATLSEDGGVSEKSEVKLPGKVCEVVMIRISRSRKICEKCGQRGRERERERERKSRQCMHTCMYVCIYVCIYICVCV